MELRIEQQAQEQRTERWVEIDLWGKALAGKQAALDVDVGEWLLAARDAQVHRYMGCATFVEYAQRRLGLDPHSINERLRVADALQGLPLTRAALARGERSWTAVRELTRVATADTEAEWLQAAAGKSARDVQQLAAGRCPGQGPRDPADPRRIRHGLRFDMPAEGYAVFREGVRWLQRNVDPRITDEEAIAMMARMVLGGPRDEGRAPYQVALVQCEDCGRVWQDARGDSVEVPPEVAERAACDGQFIGRVDGQSPEGPAARRKASQTIPPATRRQVLRRDRGRCRVPSCRNSAWVEVHHLKLRSELGDNSPSNLVSLCDCHHDRVHQGFLLVEGDAEGELTFRHPDGSVYGSDVNPQIISVQGAAYGALRQLGFRETESKQALARVRSLGGLNGTLEEVIRAALAELTTGSA